MILTVSRVLGPFSDWGTKAEHAEDWAGQGARVMDLPLDAEPVGEE